MLVSGKPLLVLNGSKLYLKQALVVGRVLLMTENSGCLSNTGLVNVFQYAFLPTSMKWPPKYSAVSV